MGSTLRFLLARLTEKSTVGGVVMFAGGALGLVMPEAMVNEVVTVITAVAGLALMFYPEKA